MYTLRGRDLSNLVEGAEARLAAQAEPWALAPSSDSGDEPVPPPVGGQGSARAAYSELVAQAHGAYHGGSCGGRACGSTCSCHKDQPVPLPPGRPSTSKSRTAATARCRPAAQCGRPQAQAAERPATGRSQSARSPPSSSARSPPSSRPSSRLLEQGSEALLPEAAMRASVDAATAEALRKQNRSLTERLQRQGQEVQRLQERLKALEEAARQAQQQRPALGQCSAPCCMPVTRLEKAGLNIEPLCELDARWAGYVFSSVSAKVKSSELSFGETFKKHRNASRKLDEAAFREFIRQFFPDVLEDRLTRLFYFADSDGSGHLTFLDFLRLFACDLNGKMGEEYFEYVMVRIHRAVVRQGGLCSTFQLRDRHLHSTISRQRALDMLLALGVGLSRREAADLAARFDAGGGEVSLKELSNAMLMCASASFVTEEWVHKLFDQVVAALHRQSGCLSEALQSVSEKGWMDRDDLRSFLHKFNPSLREGQIDRVFGFLCTGSERWVGNQRSCVDMGHFLRVVCQPRLGPAMPHRQRAGLPAEVTEHLALRLSSLCGSVSRAFDILSPCLCPEEFQASLQALGFAPDVDFEHLFSLLDVHRNGRIKRTTFIQVLENQMHQLNTPGTAAREEDAAVQIQRHFRKRRSLSRRPVQRSRTEPPTSMRKDETLREALDRRLAFARTASARKSKDEVSVSLYREALNDQQLAINRILVLENDLAYYKRQAEQASDGRARHGLVDQLRELEVANRRLAQRLRELGGLAASRTPTAGMEKGSRPPSPSLSCSQVASRTPTAGVEKGSRSSSLDTPPPPEVHSPPEAASEADGFLHEYAVVAELRDEVRVLRKEKANLQDRLFGEVHELQEQLRQAQDCAGSPGKASLSGSLLSSPPGRLSSKSGVRRTAVVKVARSAEHKLRDALHFFDASRDVAGFLEQAEGIALVGRFVVRDVLTVESDSLTLRCADAFMRREVAVKLPVWSSPRARKEFLRECCIYSLLSEVPEVQRILFFPGLPEGLLFSVMELLQGRLLSEHLRSCRSGGCPALPLHEAAQLCDALLHGLEECHSRGAVHLDLKPSAVWEAQQPEVMVKILDFGLAQLTNLSLLAPDARHFFAGASEGGLGNEEEASNPIFEVVSEEVDRVPTVADGPSAWAAFAPVAQLARVGSPWYMSPARLCVFALRHQRAGVPQPDLRWCEQPREASCDGRKGAYVEKAEAGGMDVAGVLQLSEAGASVQASWPAPHYPEGAYFEVVLRKVWPQQLLGSDPEEPNGPVGLALGFTCVAPEGGSDGTCRAREWPGSWVVGYDGRAFCDGAEVWPSQDDGQESVLAAFKRRRAEAAEASGTTRQCWPAGPLGWSLAELDRGDRLGVLAERGGHLALYVNGTLLWRIRMDGIAGHELLYPLVEICGLAREVALEPLPQGPPGTDLQGLLANYREQVDTLSLRTISASADMYAAALIAQECFLSDVALEVPPAFIFLLTTTALWLRHGRPAVAQNGNLLLALTEWSGVDRICPGLPPGVAEVLRIVLNRGMGEQRSGPGGTIRSVQEFRLALNERTRCCHLAPEFLQSHLKPLSGNAQARSRTRCTFNRDHPTDVSQGEIWDLSPWTLSTSHVRRAAMVLRSKDGAHIRVVSLSRLEATVPLELKLSLARCLRGSKPEDEGEKDGARPSIGLHVPLSRRSNAETRAKDFPQLQFGDALFPTDDCPVPFSQLQRANAVGLVLRFVRRVDLTWHTGSSEPEPAGVGGAALLAEALQQNPILEELKARGQGFGDEGTALLGAALRRESRLLLLDLRSNSVGEGGVRALVEALQDASVTLRSLDLTSNCLGSSGCCHLALMLRNNSTLSSLFLQRNSIGADGAVAIAEGLLHNHALEELDLGRNAVGAVGAGALMRASRASASLVALNLQDNSLDVCAAAQMAQSLNGVAGMTLARSVERNASLGKAASWTGSSIQRFNLRHNSLGSKGASMIMSALKASSRLSTLNLAWNDLGLEAAPAVAELLGPSSTCALEELDLRDSCLGDGAALGRALETMARALAQDGSEDDHASNVSRGRASCMEAPPRPSVAAARGFSRASSMLSAGPGPASGLQVPGGGRPGAQEQALSSRGAASSPAQRLRRLNLGNSRLDARGAALLAKALPCFESLEVLLLYNNMALGATGRVMATSLSHSSRSGSAATEAPVGLELVPGSADRAASALRELARGLPPALRRLSLGSCGLGDGAGAEVLAALAGRPALEDLDLSDNCLGGLADPAHPGGRLCRPLCGLLAACPGLARLGLALNGLGDALVVELLRALSGDAAGSKAVVDLTANRVSEDMKAAAQGRCDRATAAPGSLPAAALSLLAAAGPQRPEARLLL